MRWACVEVGEVWVEMTREVGRSDSGLCPRWKCAESGVVVTEDKIEHNAPDQRWFVISRNLGGEMLYEWKFHV